MEDIKLQSHVGGATNEQFFSNKIKIRKHGFRQGFLGKKNKIIGKENAVS